MKTKETDAWLKMIGRAAKDCRNRAKLSQREVARLTGMSNDTVIRLERGHNSVGMGSIVKYLIAVGATPATLFGGTAAKAVHQSIDRRMLHGWLDEILDCGVSHAETVMRGSLEAYRATWVRR